MSIPTIGVTSQRFVVEVRDKDLNRVGQILPIDMDFSYEGAHNNVGTWTLELPLEHPMVPVLSTPGAGIILYGPNGVLDSGPVVMPQKQITPTDPSGTATFSGVTDNVLLADALAWPVPGSQFTSGQTLSHDVRSGPAETLMHAYVNANLGPGAPLDRRGPLAQRVVMGPNLGRGPVRNKSARFNVLGELLAEIALTGELGFRIVQTSGGVLEFQTFQVANRTGTIRLDVRNRTLSGQKTALSAPGVTHVLVAGQGEGENRDLNLYWTGPSYSAMEEWGRRIERFVDQRQTDDPDEYAQKALEVLVDEGFTGVSLTAIPSDEEVPTMRFGVDWGLGDKVTAVVDATEYPTVVVGMAIKINSEGTRVAAKLGSSAGGEGSGSFETRLSALERNAESITRNDLETAVTTGVSSGLTSGLAPIDARLDALEAAPKTAAGTANLTIPTTSGNASVSVTFPTDRFTTTPSITTQIRSAAGALINATTLITTATETGFTVGVYRAGNAAPTTAVPVTVFWQAMESH